MNILRRNLKKIIAVLCLGVMFLLSGLFFAGCGGSDLENLTLSANHTSISLYKGETKDVQFTIGNYNDSIDNGLSFSLVDSTSSTNSSEHVDLKVVSQQGATTTVQLTGLSGGSTTLVAMTNEGSKTCKVNIEVLQYSSSIALKNNLALYVSKNQAFVPGSDMFDFDNNSTEKNLTFHFANNVESVGDNNRFAKVALDESNTLHFYYESGEENTEIESTNLAYDGQTFSAFARYNYYEYVDGNREERTIVVPFSFCALQGFEENSIIVEGADIVEGAEGDEVTLIVNSRNEDDRTAKLNVKIPYSAINPTIADSLENSYVRFEYSVDDSSVLSVEKSNESFENQMINFDLTLTSSTMISQETNLKLKIYYYVDGKSFDNGENSVCQTKNIVVDLNVAPMNITVNGITNDAEEKPTYQLYNYYYGSTGGVQLDVKVYEPNSDYQGVKVLFDSSKVQLLHKGDSLTNGEIIQKEDIVEPITLRGAINGEAIEGEVTGEVTFEVVSEYTEANINYKVKYSVTNGARELTFADESFNYQNNSANTGVFLSLKGGTQQFSGLLVDQPFSNANLTFIEGDVGALSVSYAGMGEQTNGKYPLIFNLTPRMIGDATYSVTLDNGVTKRITFRVIDTFDDLSLVLNTSQSVGVQSYEIVENAEYDVAMNLILKNEADKNGVINYSSNAYLSLISSTVDTFSRIDYTTTDLVNISRNINQNSFTRNINQNSFTIGVNSFGTANINFEVFGVSVEGFKKIDNFKKTALVNLVSYVPVSSFNMANSQTDSYATVVDLFVGNSVTNSSLQTVSFSEVVLPNIAYGFYNPILQQFENENYSSEFIYWTLNGASIFKQVDGSWQISDTMIYDPTASSNVYRIGESATEYYGTFDTASKSFSVNRSLNRTFSVTLYATLRQYGETRHFAVTINGVSYDNVTGISANLKEMVFSVQKMDYQFGVYLNPFTATDTDITIKYVSQNSGKALINESDIIKTETSKGIYIISVSLNRGILNESGGTFAGELQIIPNSWINAGAVLPSYQNSILRIAVSYANGSTENRYILQTAQDILAIGSSAEAMRSHYKLSTTIDVSSIANQLPLGKGMGVKGSDLAFTGSIIGEKDARIVGISIENGTQNYGLFAILGEGSSISGITFEGQINISNISSATDIDYVNIGLLAGESSAELKNVSATIYTSKVNVTSSQNVNIGGLVGVNKGKIISPNVLFDGYLDVSSSNDSIYVGGIAGENSGDISGIDGENSGDISETEKDSSKYGYSAYSVYALIRVTNLSSFDENTFKSSNLKGTAGSVAGKSSGTLTILLAGGDIWSKNAGGLVGEMVGGSLSTATTRTFVRGTTIGLIVSSYNSGSIVSITVEAIDNGVFLSEKASMGVLYSSSKLAETNFDLDYKNLSYNSLTFNKIFLGTALSDISGIPLGYLTNGTASSYVERGLVELEAGLNEIVISRLSLLEYYGNFIVVDDSDLATVTNRANFNEQTTSFSVTPNEESGFMQLHCDDCDETNCTCENIVYFAYYFDAVGYYNNGEYVTNNMTAVQNSLDVLNRLKPGDALYPFSVVGDDVTIKSTSPIVEISPSNEIYIKGTGLAQIEVYSLRNENNKQTIYLYIINYFNYYAYKENIEAGIFKLNGISLGGDATLNVYTQKGLNIDVEPVYSLTRETFGEGKVLAYGLSDSSSFSISTTGQVLLNNQLIQLATMNDFEIGLIDSSLTYGNYELTSQGIRFTKKPGVTLGDSAKDTFGLSASIFTSLNQKTYSLLIMSLDEITLNYKEGAKAIYSNFDSYTISSSHSIKDEVEIDSDEKNDELVIKIYDSQNVPILIESTESVTDGSTETLLSNPLSDLFDVKATNNETNSLKFNVEIRVDTNSTAFENRFTNNIYGTYTVKYYAVSNGEEVAKEVKLTLVKNSVDVIVASNYPEMSDLSQESDKVVPGAYGLLSVSISPVDADFESISIQNASKNSLEGSATADFSAGTLSIDDGQIVFEPITYVVVDGGIKIRQSDLANETFNGQIYVRYIFSNKSVIDGTSVGIVITAEQDGGNYYKQFDYTLLRKDAVSIEIDGYPYKDQVARGVEYKLDVKNEGYDSSTLSVLSSDPSIATIELRDDGYYLVMTNDEITDYAENGGKDFTLTVSASKLDEFGQTSETSATLQLTMLEYVINRLPNAEDEDLIEGMNGGVVTSAVGERTELSFNFDEMLEYNPSNQSVLNKLSVFIESLKENGSWTYYTDLNANNNEGVQIYPTPLQKDRSTKSTVTTTDSISTRYLSTSGYSFTTYVAHDPTNRHYFFSYSGQYKVQSGQYVWTERVGGGYPEGYEVIDVEIDVYSFLRGSEESPNPITTYEEFLNMTAGGHYILLNDIVVPSEDFVPLNTEIATFDGNNHYFIFDSPVYQLGSVDVAGLFGSVGPSTFIKNVKVRIGGETNKAVTFNSSATTTASIGVVAGVNNGSIYNAQVEMASGAKLFVTFDSDPSTSGFYFGGIVGQNSGYLTNSLSKVNVQSVITIGGVVGQNSNIIASTAFKEGMLVSTSIYLDVFSTSGFVGENTLNGKILTSFTSGYVSSTRPYSLQTENGKTSMISSSVSASSFVFNNEGEIADCYSNLPIQSGGMSAGFAFYNSGSISRSFSTSFIVRDSSANDYIFASDIVSGKFVDCYYIKGNEINNSLLIPTLEGVLPLNFDTSNTDSIINEFANLEEKFSSYGYSTTPSYNSVWFYSSGQTSNLFNGMQFAGGRLELVSANMISNGQRINTGMTTSPNGEITYHYETAPSSPADGSAFNPFVIHSPETMESYMSNSSNILTGYYRLACEIDYSSMPGDYSNLYNKSLKGSFDGNGMTIRGIRITSNKVIDYAGLFSEISGSSVNFASVSNLIIIPEVVNFSNVNAVGCLAGTVRNANVFNISVKGVKSEDESENTTEDIVTVSGKNVVGGVIGYATENFNIKNIDAYVGSFASYVPSTDDTNDIVSSTIDKLSYGGGIIGYAGGIGKISNVTLYRGAVNVFADKAGLAFGGIASQVSADHVSLNINSAMKIKAHSYGGIVVGELKGTLTNAYVYGTDENLEIFDLKPYVATAVGGVVGLASDKAKLDYIYMGQSFSIQNQASASVSVNTISYVGGVVGAVSGGAISISRTLVDASITARNILGGVIGEVRYVENGGTSVELNEIAVKEGVLRVEGQNASPVLGGIVGRIASNEEGVNANLTRLNITNSYVWSNMELDVYTYSVPVTANVGALIGGAETRNISLDSIYSTSLYDISIRDLSQSGSERQVVRKSTVGPGGILEYTPNSYIYAGEEQTSNDNSIGGFFYENSFKGILNEENVKNVYNSAIWNFDDSGTESQYNKYDYLTQGFTTITILKGNTQFVINQNELGKSLYDYNVTNLSETESYLDRLNLEAYYGMFMTLSADVLDNYISKDILSSYGNNLSGLCSLLGVESEDKNINTNISLNDLEDDYYEFVGYTDNGTTITLNFKKSEISDLCDLLGVESEGKNINTNIPLNDLEKGYCKFVGYTDDNTTKTRTLNFEKCDDIIWTASSTAFSTLAFEENMKI